MKSTRNLWTAIIALSGAAAIVIAALSAFAVVPQPVLKIAALGSNQFSITITNGVSTTNYSLYWTLALKDDNYPWQVLGTGSTGQTNFTVDGSGWPVGFFEVVVGADLDADGVPDWQDAQPLNPSVGILTLTIDNPTNGFTFN